jgi:hypothetical protein
MPKSTVRLLLLSGAGLVTVLPPVSTALVGSPPATSVITPLRMPPPAWLLPLSRLSAAFVSGSAAGS